MEPTRETQVHGVVTSYIDGWNRHDPDAMTALFTPDVDFVNVLGTHHRGRPSIEQELRFLHAGVMKDTNIRLLEQEVRLLAPDVAISHVHWELTGQARWPGWNPPEVRRGVFTYVVVERDGEWRIRAAHNTDVINVPPS